MSLQDKSSKDLEIRGFSATNPDSFLWWSLNINEEDITAAEERYLEKLFPDRMKKREQLSYHSE